MEKVVSTIVTYYGYSLCLALISIVVAVCDYIIRRPKPINASVKSHIMAFYGYYTCDYCDEMFTNHNSGICESCLAEDLAERLGIEEDARILAETNETAFYIA
jgi:hypothetical protein